jgi:hypothetical protein
MPAKCRKQTLVLTRVAISRADGTHLSQDLEVALAVAVPIALDNDLGTFVDVANFALCLVEQRDHTAVFKHGDKSHGLLQIGKGCDRAGG